MSDSTGIEALRRRQHAADRSPPLADGERDPLPRPYRPPHGEYGTHRPHDDRSAQPRTGNGPVDLQATGLALAAQHLADHGLAALAPAAELRAAWRHADDAQRAALATFWSTNQ